MTQAVATASPPGELIESVITKGDLAKLTPQERTKYYVEVCKSVGLNPLTKPFEYITLNNKLTLYALRNCTDQLRTIHGVSVEELTESERDGVFIVTAKVKNRDGRTDMAKGAVMIQSLKGEALANAMMKAETKAKRRATLSLCGLGFLDETEIETIPAAARQAAPQPVAIAPPHDPETGEIRPVTVPVPDTAGGGRNWIMWGQAIIAGIRRSTTHRELDEWERLNQIALGDCNEGAPKAYGSIDRAFAETRAKIGPEPEMLTEHDTQGVLAAK